MSKLIHDRLKELLHFSEGEYLDYKRIIELENASDQFLEAATKEYTIQHYTKAREFIMEYLNSYDCAKFTRTATETRLSYYNDQTVEGVCGVQLALLPTEVHARQIVLIDGVLCSQPRGIFGV